MKELKKVKDSYHIDNLLRGKRNIDRAKKEIQETVSSLMRHVESNWDFEDAAVFRDDAWQWTIFKGKRGRVQLSYGSITLYEQGQYRQVATPFVVDIRREWLQKLLEIVQARFPNVNNELAPFATAANLYDEMGE